MKRCKCKAPIYLNVRRVIFFEGSVSISVELVVYIWYWTYGRSTTMHILHNIRPQMRNARRMSDGRRAARSEKRWSSTSARRQIHRYSDRDTFTAGDTPHSWARNAAHDANIITCRCGCRLLSLQCNNRLTGSRNPKKPSSDDDSNGEIDPHARVSDAPQATKKNIKIILKSWNSKRIRAGSYMQLQAKTQWLQRKNNRNQREMANANKRGRARLGEKRAVWLSLEMETWNVENGLPEKTLGNPILYA